MNTSKLTSLIVLTGALIAMNSASYAAERTTGRGTGPVIYVTSQGLYYDSIVLTDVPDKGNFQQLIPTENGLTTDYGPGQPGHLGGRWWIDVNEDGIRDSEDQFFLCPLLGPGRETM